MERNEGIERELTGGQSEANEFSGSGSAPPQGGADGAAGAAGFDFAGASSASDQSPNLKERAKNVLGTASGKLADVGSTVRERAGIARDKLADALESGAERIRDRAHSGGTLAGATAEGSTAIQEDGKIVQVSDRLAGGMEKSAEWLRDADIDGLKTGIENQVKEHPGRTLLIAAGLGYLLGRAFRSKQ